MGHLDALVKSCDPCGCLGPDVRLLGATDIVDICAVAPMYEHPVFEESERLAGDLCKVFECHLSDERRSKVSTMLCAISIEHGGATRVLAASSLFTSAIAVVRSQYEAVVRGVWVCYSASEADLEKLTADLNSTNQQAAKNLPSVNEMLADLAKVPDAAIPYQAFTEFRQSSWTALNSYVHAGLHPLSRSMKGYPVELVVQFVKVSNALAVVAAMQVAMFTGYQSIVRGVRDLHVPYANCLPPHKKLDAP